MNSTIYIIITLITAHLTGDFLLQTNNDVEKKKEWKVFTKHILTLTGLSYLFLGAWNIWQVPLIILLSHALIDQVKLRWLKKSISNFFIDQSLHLIVIILIAYYYSESFNELSGLFWIRLFDIIYVKILIVISSFILVTVFSGICVGMIIKPYQEKLGTIQSEEARWVDIGAGKMIGYLERFLILVLLLSNNAAGIGFLITAKSILRFSEIKNNRDRSEVEYILIGTLLSFSFGLIIAIGTNYVFGEIK